MRDEISIGAVPTEEPCEQLGDRYDAMRARRECRAFIGQLRRVFGDEQGSARLLIRANPHDFGTYLEVVCTYAEDDRVGYLYALKIEGNVPDKWDAVAKLDLAR